MGKNRQKDAGQLAAEYLQQQQQYHAPVAISGSATTAPLVRYAPYPNIELQSKADSTPDYLLPFDTLMARANAGNASAELLVGIALRTGFFGCTKNVDAGSDWVVRASQHSDESPAVLCAKGKCFDLGLGGEDVNSKQADEFFERSIMGNYPPAMVERARNLYDTSFTERKVTDKYGNTVTIKDQNDDRLRAAVELLLKAAKAKYPPAYELLSNCYANGHGVKENIPEAFKYIKLSVDSGNSSGNGKKLLGDYYKRGWGGVTKDISKARDLYKEARAQGEDIGNRLKSSCCTIS